MNPQDLEKWRRAAAIACHVRKYAASLAKPGAKLIDIALAGHARIEELGGKPAFPLQMSRNHIAAHYCAWIGDPTTLQEGDVVKIDCGVHVDGFVADTAMTVDLALDDRNRKLVESSQAALDAAIRVAGPDVDVVEIGREVERVIRSFGYSPVKNLTGHSVGRWIIHGPPQIPNVPVGRGKLRPGTCVAIEPFASTGAGIVKESGDAHVFMVRRDLKKAKGVDDAVYEAIRAFGGLPFGSRDLVAHLPFKAVSDSLNALSRDDQLMVYPPLCEKKGELVAQFEHTLLITDSGVEVLTASEDALRTPLSV